MTVEPTVEPAEIYWENLSQPASSTGKFIAMHLAAATFCCGLMAALIALEAAYRTVKGQHSGNHCPDDVDKAQAYRDYTNPNVDAGLMFCYCR